MHFLAITAIVNALGLSRQPGAGVAEKICGFVLMVPSAYMQAMSAFVAQNMGAGRPDWRKALAGAIGTSLAVGVVLSYFSFFHGGLLAQLLPGTQPLSRRRRNTSKPMPLTVCSCLSCFALWATLTAVGALLLS